MGVFATDSNPRGLFAFWQHNFMPLKNWTFIDYLNICYNKLLQFT